MASSPLRYGKGSGTVLNVPSMVSLSGSPQLQVHRSRRSPDVDAVENLRRCAARTGSALFFVASLPGSQPTAQRGPKQKPLGIRERNSRASLSPAPCVLLNDARAPHTSKRTNRKRKKQSNDLATVFLHFKSLSILLRLRLCSRARFCLERGWRNRFMRVCVEHATFSLVYPTASGPTVHNPLRILRHLNTLLSPFVNPRIALATKNWSFFGICACRW